MERENEAADVRVLAARVRVKADKRLRRTTPPNIRELASRYVAPARQSDRPD
jgi:predicted transcriptional regulator